MLPFRRLQLSRSDATLAISGPRSNARSGLPDLALRPQRLQQPLLDPHDVGRFLQPRWLGLRISLPSWMPPPQRSSLSQHRLLPSPLPLQLRRPSHPLQLPERTPTSHPARPGDTIEPSRTHRNLGRPPLLGRAPRPLPTLPSISQFSNRSTTDDHLPHPHPSHHAHQTAQP